VWLLSGPLGATIDDYGNNSGIAYLIRWNGSAWVQEQKLRPASGAGLSGYDGFGISVAVAGDVVVVGADQDDDEGSQSGSAYVFRWNGTDWPQEQKLLASDGSTNDHFGISVAAYDDRIIVGASLNDGGGPQRGAAYVFRWNPGAPGFWEQEQKLQASDAANLDEFGNAVSIFGDVVVVGAHWDADNDPLSGSAYVFRWNGSIWEEEQKLIAPGGTTEDEFGISVSVSGDVAVVGAFQDDASGSNSGSAYVFRWNGSSWMHQQELVPLDGAAHDWFGMSVAVSEDTIVVGAPNGSGNSIFFGSAYVFNWNGSSWFEAYKLLASDGAYGDTSGSSVAVFDDIVLWGADHDDDNGVDSGSVYVFNIGPCNPGTYGEMCLPCPGGMDNPCSGHGTCDDGVTGSGTCSCNTGYVGVACNQCASDSDGDGVCDVDDVCIDGDDHIDADGNGVPDACEPVDVPTVSAWGLAVLGLGLLVIAKLQRRRRLPE